MPEFNKEQVAIAYQILGGIPEKQIDLNAFIAVYEGDHACGTIACGAGWLAMHPHFRAQGLIAQEGDMRCEIKGQKVLTYYSIEYIFGEDTYEYLFCERGHGKWDQELLNDDPTISDKQLLCARLKKAYYD